MIFKRQENVMQLLKEQSNLRCKLGRCLIDKLANLQYDGNDLHFLLKKDFERGLKKKPGTYLQKAQVPIISSNDLNYKMVDYNQNLKYSIIFFLEELSVVRFVRVAKK